MELDMAMNEIAEHCLMSVTRGILFVFNLDASVTDDVLKQFLQPLGDLHWCRVVVDTEGKSLGHAYAKFATDEKAKVVMKRIVEMEPVNNGRTPAALPSDIKACTRLRDAGKLIISGLDSTVTQEALADELVQYGESYSVQITKATYAVVHFTSELFSRAAIAGIHDKELFGKKASVIHYNQVPKAVPQGPNRLVLKPFNLDPEVDNKQLKEMFSFLGPVVARVEKNAHGTSRGCGYVLFEKPATDTPLFLSFAPYTMPDGRIVLANSFTPQTIQKKPHTDCANYMKFTYGSTPHLYPHGYLYTLPPNNRPYQSDLHTIQNLPPDHHIETILPAYHVHVTHIGDRDDAALRAQFERYGRVLFVYVGRPPTVLVPYAIVTFKLRAAAVLAVEYTRMIRATGRELNATLLDTYQYFHQLTPPPTSLPPTRDDYMQQLDEYRAVTQIPVGEVTKMMEQRLDAITNNVKKATEELDRKLAAGKTDGQTPGTSGKDGVQPADDTFTNETFRLVIIDKIAKLFSHSSEKSKADMLETAMKIELKELSEMLMDDHKFRIYFVRKNVEEAKKLQNEAKK